MPATQTQNDAPRLTADERKAARETLAPKFQAVVRTFSAAAQVFGREFSALVAELEDYFTAAEVKAGKLDAWIENTCGLSRASWKRYVQVSNTLAEMDAADVAKISEHWAVDGMTELTRLNEDERKALVKRVGGKASTKTIRAAAEAIKPRKTRDVPTEGERTFSFATKIREAVQTHLAGNPAPMVSAMFGAQLQKDNPKEDVPEALLHLISNPNAPVESADSDDS